MTTLKRSSNRKDQDQTLGKKTSGFDFEFLSLMIYK